MSGIQVEVWFGSAEFSKLMAGEECFGYDTVGIHVVQKTDKYRKCMIPRELIERWDNDENKIFIKAEGFF